MRRALAGVITVALLGLMFWSARDGADKVGDGPPSDRDDDAATETKRRDADPYTGAERRVRDLLADARAGDVGAYLAGFDEPLRGRYEREAAEHGPEAFADRLREAAAARKSHAVFAPEPDGPDAARVTVESVYPDRNERQTFRLRLEGGRWLVADVESPHARQPEARYGAPASFMPPEAPPVPTGD